MHQGIVNANNLQLSEQTNYKPVSFGYLLSNDCAKLSLKHIKNHKPQPGAMYALHGQGVMPWPPLLQPDSIVLRAAAAGLVLQRALRFCRVAIQSPSKPAT